MKSFFNIHVLVFTLLVFVLVVSCADVETETSGYAALEISLDDVSNRKTGRSKLVPNFTHGLGHSMTSSDAATILAVLMPAVKCESSSANSGSEYSRALVAITAQNVKLAVPLDTQVKLCLYFSVKHYLSMNWLQEPLHLKDLANQVFLRLIQKLPLKLYQLNSGLLLIQRLRLNSAVLAVQVF